MKATKSFSVSDWCRNFEITFQGEQGMGHVTPYKSSSIFRGAIIVSFSRRRLGRRATRMVRIDMRRAVRPG